MTQQKQKRAGLQAPNPKAVPNGEVLQRLNFLHQAAHYMATATVPMENPSGLEDAKQQKPKTKQLGEEAEGSNIKQEMDKLKKERMQTKEHCRKANPCQPMTQSPMLGLSQSLSKSMKVISKKAVLRMDPYVKHSICKSCNVLLIPGHTSSSRVISSRSHQHKVKVTCSVCNHAHSIPHPPESTTSPDLPNTSRQFQEEENSSEEKKIPFWKQPQHVTFADQKVVEGGI